MSIFFFFCKNALKSTDTVSTMNLLVRHLDLMILFSLQDWWLWQKARLLIVIFLILLFTIQPAAWINQLVLTECVLEKLCSNMLNEALVVTILNWNYVMTQLPLWFLQISVFLSWCYFIVTVIVFVILVTDIVFPFFFMSFFQGYEKIMHSEQHQNLCICPPPPLTGQQGYISINLFIFITFRHFRQYQYQE